MAGDSWHSSKIIHADEKTQESSKWLFLGNMIPGIESKAPNQSSDITFKWIGPQPHRGAFFYWSRFIHDILDGWFYLSATNPQPSLLPSCWWWVIGFDFKLLVHEQLKDGFFIARRSRYPPNMISTHCEQKLTTVTSRNSTSTVEAVSLSTEVISLTRENSNT